MMSEYPQKSLTDSDSRAELEPIHPDQKAAYQMIEDHMLPNMTESDRERGMILQDLSDLGDKIKIPHPGSKDGYANTNIRQLLRVVGIASILESNPETSFKNIQITAATYSILVLAKNEFWNLVTQSINHVRIPQGADPLMRKATIRNVITQLLETSDEPIITRTRKKIGDFGLRKKIENS